MGTALSMGTRIDLPTKGRPGQTICGDLNHDGYGDIAVFMYLAKSVIVKLNEGDSRFKVESDVEYPLLAYPAFIVVGDIDSDDDSDLVVLCASPNQANLLYNDGNGGFQQESTIPLVGAVPHSCTLADMDGDTDLDIAITVAEAGSYRVLAFSNVGDRLYSITDTLSISAAGRGIVAADIDSDSDSDLIVALPTQHQLAIFANDGLGNCEPETTIVLSGDPYSVFATDLDADGDADLAAACIGTNSLVILDNSGPGSFTFLRSHSTGLDPRFTTGTDLDEDGDMDIVVTNRISGTISLFRNNGAGELSDGESLLTGESPSSVSPCRMAPDGNIDLVFTNAGSRTISIFPNQGVGIFRSPISGTVIGAQRAVCFTDVNNDRSQDVAVASVVTETSSRISVFRTDVAGDSLTPTYSTANAMDVVDISGGDVDGDGDNDLVTVNYNGRLYVYINGGSGSFVLDGYYGGQLTPADLELRDFDSDGDLDALVGNAVPIFSGGITYLAGNGDGTFQTGVSYPLSNPCSALTARDFDNDGDLDVAVVRTASDSIFVLLNGGVADFNITMSSFGGTAANAITSGDLDGDGDYDLATTVVGADSVSILFNDGNANFLIGGRYATAKPSNSLVALDLDGDTDIDLATANDSSDNVTLLINNGSGAFTDRLDIGVGNGPVAMDAADIDQDGDVDLAVSNANSGTVLIIENLVKLPVVVDEDLPQLGKLSMSLEQNYPNPFNGITSLSFELPVRSVVNLSVYNILGQLVATLIDGEVSKGSHSIPWDGRNSSGNELSSGIYLYSLKSSNMRLSKKMLLLK